MEYRPLPHGNEMIGVLGLGMGGIQHTPPEEIEAIIRKAIDSGINFFDLCAGGAVYAPFGRAIAKAAVPSAFCRKAAWKPSAIISDKIIIAPNQ